MAGELGLDPGPFTARQLCIMHGAALEERWTRTAATMALLANLWRDPKRKPEPWRPRDFHPMAPKPEPIPADITALKVFTQMRPAPPR